MLSSRTGHRNMCFRTAVPAAIDPVITAWSHDFAPLLPLEDPLPKGKLIKLSSSGLQVWVLMTSNGLP